MTTPQLLALIDRTLSDYERLELLSARSGGTRPAARHPSLSTTGSRGPRATRRASETSAETARTHTCEPTA
jgi:hypothetical protein